MMLLYKLLLTINKLDLYILYLVIAEKNITKIFFTILILIALDVLEILVSNYYFSQPQEVILKQDLNEIKNITNKIKKDYLLFDIALLIIASITQTNKQLSIIIYLILVILMYKLNIFWVNEGLLNLNYNYYIIYTRNNTKRYIISKTNLEELDDKDNIKLVRLDNNNFLHV